MDQVTLNEVRVLVYRSVWEGDLDALDEIDDLLDRLLDSRDTEAIRAFTKAVSEGNDELMRRS
jgi:hypothetical protein